MKKFLLAYILFFCCHVLFAIEMTATGYGVTEEAALNSARVNLAGQFQVQVTNFSVTSLSEAINSSSSDYENSYSSLTLSSTLMDLKGARETIRKIGDREYEATCTLTEESAGLYYVSLLDLESSISSIGMQLNACSNKDRLALYPILISAMKEYELYRTVILMIAPDQYEIRPLPIGNRATVEAEYRMALSKEINAEELTIQDLQNRIDLGLATIEIEEKLRASIAAQESLRAQKKALDLAEEEAYKASREKLQQEILLAMDIQETIAESTMNEKEQSISGRITNIEATRNTFKEIKESLDLYEGELLDSFLKEKEAYIQKVIDQGFFPSQLENGKPKPEEITKWEALLQTDLDTMLADYGKTAASVYYSAYLKLVNLNKTIHEELQELSSISFEVTPANYDIAIVVDAENFNDTAFAWPATAYVSIGTESIEIPFLIPYESLTGESVAYNSMKEFLRLQENIEYWSGIFRTYSNAISISFPDVRVEGSVTSCTYRIILPSIVLTRSDNSHVFHKEKLDISRYIVFNERVVNLSDYTIKNDYLLRNY